MLYLGDCAVVSHYHAGFSNPKYKP